VKEALKTTLRIIEKNGQIHENQAEIVWANRNSDEKMTFGFKFIDNENKVLDIVSF